MPKPWCRCFVSSKLGQSKTTKEIVELLDLQKASSVYLSEDFILFRVEPETRSLILLRESSVACKGRAPRLSQSQGSLVACLYRGRNLHVHRRSRRLSLDLWEPRGFRNCVSIRGETIIAADALMKLLYGRFRCIALNTLRSPRERFRSISIDIADIVTQPGWETSSHSASDDNTSSINLVRNLVPLQLRFYRTIF